MTVKYSKQEISFSCCAIMLQCKLNLSIACCAYCNANHTHESRLNSFLQMLLLLALHTGQVTCNNICNATLLHDKLLKMLRKYSFFNICTLHKLLTFIDFRKMSSYLAFQVDFLQFILQVH